MTRKASWHVLILEEMGTQGNQRRELTKATHIDGDYQQARRAALETARTYLPEHPMFEKSREVFQTSDDSWLVNVEGSTSWYYFNVQVADLIESTADRSS